MQWLGNSLWVFDISTAAKCQRMLEVFTYARQRYGINLFVIDNLSKLDIDPDDYNKQRDFVDKLTDFTKDHDVHIILVAHMRKGKDDKVIGGKFDVLGGGSITNLADTVLIWFRNREKEEAFKNPTLKDDEVRKYEAQPDVTCKCEKQRNGEDEPVINLWFHKASHQFLGAPGVSPRKYVHYSTTEQPSADLAGIDAEVF